MSNDQDQSNGAYAALSPDGSQATTKLNYTHAKGGIAYWICVAGHAGAPSYDDYAYVLVSMHCELLDAATSLNNKHGPTFNTLFAQREALQCAEEAWRQRSRTAMQRHIRAYYAARRDESAAKG